MRRIPQATRLILLPLFLLSLWLLDSVVVPQEERVILERIRSGHASLWARQEQLGLLPSLEVDPGRTGMIGVEWSEMTTTLGSLEAKRVACNPLWGVRFRDWFDELGLEEGDRVAVYSSSSFPGMLLAALVAIEERGLDPLLSVSLGSSTWGANRLDFPWPAMSAVLREDGVIRAAAEFYTLGGTGDRGGDFEGEVVTRLEAAAVQEGVPLYIPASLQEAVEYKSRRLREFDPKLLISIGGPAANFGDGESSPELPTGLILPGAGPSANGVIGRALASGIPVINVLNLHRLAPAADIPWDGEVMASRKRRPGYFASLLGVALFALVLARHRRWEWQ